MTESDIGATSTLLRSEDAYLRIRAAILDGALAPGDVYSLRSLGEYAEVGVTPLREAVRRLQAEGLLDWQRNRRIAIAPLRYADFREVTAMRITLEALAVRLTVPRLTPGDLADAARALQAADAALAAQDLASLQKPHREFHEHFWSKAGARHTAVLRDAWQFSERYRRLLLSEDDDKVALQRLSWRQHVAILEAAEAGDERLCARLSAEHIAQAALTLLARDSEPGDEVHLALRLVQDASAANAHR